jgi:hypothetical protein
MTLLETIWGDTPGKRFILSKRGGQKTGGQSTFFYDNASAIEFMREKNEAGYDVWFGLALFGPTEKRDKQNAQTAKSFWLDIDCGPDKPYADINEAAASLATFCHKLNLPLPTLVGSGVGLHAHWIVDTRIEKDRWEKSARALKNACGRNNLGAGPERTADIASVLRAPGTRHLKDINTPREVTIIGEIQPTISIALFEQAVAPYIVIDNSRVANKVFETNLPQLPYDAEKIADECAVIGEMRDTQGCVSEPVWYGALQVLGHCVDGEEIAHKWSEGYDGYSYQGTEEKYERAKEFGPTLCTRFAEYEPAKCGACRHNGRITTPLQLGAVLTPVVIKPVDTAAIETSYKPEYITPPHYEIGEQGVYFYDEESEKRVAILDVPLWVSQLTDTIRESDMEATIEWVTRTGRHRKAAMRVDVLMDVRATGMWLATHGITGFSPRNVEAVKNYLWACIQVYQHTKDVETVYEHFGWTDGGFVLGETIFFPGRVAQAKLATRVPSKMKTFLVEKGAFEAWAQATKSLDHPKYLPHQFTLVATLGSILFSLMGVQGAVLSLAGDSGVGKTTIGSFGCSAFGNPRALEISPQSTEKAFHELWYVAGNLPVLINEAATLDLFKLSSLIYAAANGQARSTLTRNSELRESDGWQLLTVFTSNSHLMSLDEKWLNEANRRRILEFTLAKPEHEMDREVAITLHRTMADNFGIVGRVFIQHCVDHRVEITQMLQSSYDLYAKGDVPAEHRFNLWTVAVARVAGLICEKLGILRFDTEPCYLWAVEQVKSHASAVLTAEQKGDDLLAAYISENQGAFTRYKLKDKFWTVEIRGECAGRYTENYDGSWTLSVPAARFAVYAREHGLDKQHLARWRRERNVENRATILVPLGSRTKTFLIKMDGSLDNA